MAIKKKEISLDSIKKQFSTKTKYKPESFYNCGEAFMDACGLPGPVQGGITMYLGHSNTSKTTALIKAAADAQKKGDLPVFIITEKKWNWEHAVELGLQAELTEDGTWDGNFIYNDSFDYTNYVFDNILNILIDSNSSNKEYNNAIEDYHDIGGVDEIAKIMNWDTSVKRNWLSKIQNINLIKSD